jgi:hypothetical protein
MKKIITTAFILAAFAVAAFGLPDYEIKIVEKSAEACDNPTCAGQ